MADKNLRTGIGADGKIEDFGEYIPGARKELYKGVGISVEEFKNIPMQEYATLIVRDIIWPEPDYVGLVNAKLLRPDTAYFVRTIRKAIPPKPDFEKRFKGAEKIAETYLKFVDYVRSVATEVYGQSDFVGMAQKLADELRPWGGSAGVEWVDSDTGEVLTLSCEEHLEAGSDKVRGTASNMVSGAAALRYEAAIQRFPWNFRGDLVGVRVRQRGGKYVLYSRSNKRLSLKEFESVEEIFNYALSGELDAELDGRKQEKKVSSVVKVVRPQLEHIERVGPNIRGGVDAVPTRLMDTFGFRGGQFGNWNNQDDRQACLNYAFDALCDLSYSLGVPLRFWQLDRKAGATAGSSSEGRTESLGIAFGSRGVAGAAAHYEPELHVINLTKLNGAGSLAHELGHVLDYWLGAKVAPYCDVRKVVGTWPALTDLVTGLSDKHRLQRTTDELLDSEPAIGRVLQSATKLAIDLRMNDCNVTRAWLLQKVNCREVRRVNTLVCRELAKIQGVLKSERVAQRIKMGARQENLLFECLSDILDKGYNRASIESISWSDEIQREFPECNIGLILRETGRAKKGEIEKVVSEGLDKVNGLFDKIEKFGEKAEIEHISEEGYTVLNLDDMRDVVNIWLEERDLLNWLTDWEKKNVSVPEITRDSFQKMTGSWDEDDTVLTLEGYKRFLGLLADEEEGTEEPECGYPADYLFCGCKDKPLYSKEHRSLYYDEAMRLDVMRHKPYYSTLKEMWARAFEHSIEMILTERGIKSQYLVHSTGNGFYSMFGMGKPYPEKFEAERFRDDLEQLILTLKQVGWCGNFDDAVRRCYAVDHGRYVSYQQNVRLTTKQEAREKPNPAGQAVTVEEFRRRELDEAKRSAKQEQPAPPAARPVTRLAQPKPGETVKSVGATPPPAVRIMPIRKPTQVNGGISTTPQRPTFESQVEDIIRATGLSDSLKRVGPQWGAMCGIVSSASQAQGIPVRLVGAIPDGWRKATMSGVVRVATGRSRNEAAIEVVAQQTDSATLLGLTEGTMLVANHMRGIDSVTDECMLTAWVICKAAGIEFVSPKVKSIMAKGDRKLLWEVRELLMVPYIERVYGLNIPMNWRMTVRK